ncbi:MAG: hypothetical protein U0271_22935 [Polyangiaceae bacterium]
MGLATGGPVGCGAKVVYQGDGEGGAGGGGEFDCIAGVCGDACTKCVDQDCFTGTCDENGVCTPPDQLVVCPE